ncbi:MULTISPECIES: hypothetical protein [unclassified Burkholderia]|uniref:hypothetical protein n=1 Tax=unclassified Burkholderia TaxID=2613784 RepID=UPI002AB1CCDC|nr:MULTISPECIES: hypothetical protein [unclassified Burkholderia]
MNESMRRKMAIRRWRDRLRNDRRQQVIDRHAVRDLIKPALATGRQRSVDALIASTLGVDVDTTIGYRNSGFGLGCSTKSQ